MHSHAANFYWRFTVSTLDCLCLAFSLTEEQVGWFKNIALQNSFLQPRVSKSKHCSSLWTTNWHEERFSTAVVLFTPIQMPIYDHGDGAQEENYVLCIFFTPYDRQ